MKISLLSDMLFDGLDGINSLSRNFFMQLSIKNSGNEFLYQKRTLKNQFLDVKFENQHKCYKHEIKEYELNLSCT